MKRTIAVIICALIAAALLLPANVDMAQADEGVSPTALSSTVINLNKTTKYYAFDGPFLFPMRTSCMSIPIRVHMSAATT